MWVDNFKMNKNMQMSLYSDFLVVLQDATVQEQVWVFFLRTRNNFVFLWNNLRPYCISIKDIFKFK